MKIKIDQAVDFILGASKLFNFYFKIILKIGKFQFMFSVFYFRLASDI